MKACIISDTHEGHEKLATLPNADLLIHCGDITKKGSPVAMEKFLIWFSAQPHANKIFVMGNHELGWDYGPTRSAKLELVKEFTDKYSNLHYLENSEVTIDGLKIFASPITPYYFGWAWNVHRGEQIAKYWENIPSDTAILISHGPPYGILDLIDQSPIDNRDPHQGCEELAKRILQLKNLKLHAFGHIHHSHGTHIENGITFVNGAICNDNNQPVREPIVVEI